jgi:dTDP-L-rhamnose 4-epimerase
MRILVTGGLGFIGLALCTRLLELGHDVICFDNLSPQIHGQIPVVAIPEGLTVIRGDVRELRAHSEQIGGCDILFHLAAETGTGQSMYRIADYVSINEVGTAALLEAITSWSRKPQRVILASSRSVYGEGAYIDPNHPQTIVQPQARSKEQLLAHEWEPRSATGSALQAIATPETLSFAPGSVYAATKASQELLLRSAGHALGFKPIILRFQNVYGEGQSLQNPYTGIISIFFNRARQGLAIPIYEDGLESRDFIHISDIVAGLMACLDADVSDETAINLGAGEPTSVSELAACLLDVAGFSVPVKVTGQFRVGDIRHCYADIGRAKSVLGFSPKISLRDGLSRFCSWAASEPVHQDKLESATEELRKKGLAN